MQICSLMEADKKKITALVPVLADAWRAKRPAAPAPLRADGAPNQQAPAQPQPEAQPQSDTQPETQPGVHPEVRRSVAPPIPARPEGPAKVGGLRKRSVKVAVPDSLAVGTDRERKPEELPPIPEDWREPVSEASVKTAYAAFIERMMEEQRTNLAATLRSAEFVLSGESMQLTVINEVQLEQLADVRPVLLDTLRRELRNAALELKVEVNQRDEPTVKYMTDRDRYDAMVEAQPGLDVLRRRLDLDLR